VVPPSVGSRISSLTAWPCRWRRHDSVQCWEPHPRTPQSSASFFPKWNSTTFQNYAELKSVFKEVVHRSCGNLAWCSAQRSGVETAVLPQWHCTKRHSLNFKQKPTNYVTMFQLYIQSFIHSIGMCRMRRFLAVFRSFFHSPLLYTLPSILFHQLLVFHPPSLHLAIYCLVYLSALLFPNSYTIPFWEFYFLPFSVHVQTNVIHLTLLSLL